MVFSLSLPPSLPPSLSLYLPPSLPLSISLPPSLPPYPPSLPLPPSLLCLPLSLPPSLLPLSLSISLYRSLSLSLSISLSAFDIYLCKRRQGEASVISYITVPRLRDARFHSLYLCCTMSAIHRVSSGKCSFIYVNTALITPQVHT